jgi:hypothetical protein
MFRPKKSTTPAKKVWRISESAPMGEWVNEVRRDPKPSKDLPEVPHGPWVRSSYDLLDGTDVTEEAFPGGLFDELFGPSQDAPEKTRR